MLLHFRLEVDQLGETVRDIKDAYQKVPFDREHGTDHGTPRAASFAKVRGLKDEEEKKKAGPQGRNTLRQKRTLKTTQQKHQKTPNVA